MSDWTTVKLIDIAAAEPSAISKPYGSAILQSDYRLQGIPVVRGVNLAQGRFLDDEFVYIDEAVAARMPGARLRSGDLVVTHRGTIGQVSMIPRRSRFESYVASTSHVKVRLDEHRALPEYVFYWFLSPTGRRSLLERASTVGVPGIAQPVATIKSIQLRLPSLSEQRAIAEVLGALDDKIAANSTSLEVLDQLGAALTEKALDGLSAPLSSLAEVTMGSSPPGSTYNEEADGLPFYQGVRDFGVRSPCRRVWTSAPLRTAEAGDTLISVRAPVGRVNVAAERLCLGRGLAGARSRLGTPNTLYHQIRAARGEWVPFEAVGTVFGAINKTQLESIAIPSVAESQRDELEAHLVTIEGLIRALLMESERLAATRDELLPLLMSGRITVRDAEEVAEAAT